MLETTLFYIAFSAITLGPILAIALLAWLSRLHIAFEYVLALLILLPFIGGGIGMVIWCMVTLVILGLVDGPGLLIRIDESPGGGLKHFTSKLNRGASFEAPLRGAPQDEEGGGSPASSC